MFERFFQWTMRYGARILFAFAMLLLAIGLAETLYWVVTVLGDRPDPAMLGDVAALNRQTMLRFAMGIVTTAQAAALPLAGAMLINHFDQRAKHPQSK